MAAKKTKKSTKKYSSAASEKVAEVMHEFKHGTLRSGGKKKVKSRAQAIAIGISEARQEGLKVPDEPAPASKASKKTSAKKSSKKKASKKA